MNGRLLIEIGIKFTIAQGKRGVMRLYSAIGRLLVCGAILVFLAADFSDSVETGLGPLEEDLGIFSLKIFGSYDRFVVNTLFVSGLSCFVLAGLIRAIYSEEH